MQRRFLLIGAGLVALPLLATAQTAVPAAAAAAPPTAASVPNTTVPKHRPRPQRGKRIVDRDASTSDRNSEPGIVADTAVRHGPNVANTGRTQPRGSAPDTPTQKAE